MITRTAILVLTAILLAACSPPQVVTTPTQTPTAEPPVTQSPAHPPFRIVAYATDGIVADIIPYDKLTHINYSFLIPNEDGTFKNINNAWKLAQIVERARRHNVRVSIAVGGWGWDQQFEVMAARPVSRAAFVQNLKAFVDGYQLDGADIDWEYPDPGASSQNYLELIRELRAAMPEKLLTTAVVSYGDGNGAGIPAEAFELLDFVNVMTYDGPDHASMEQFQNGLAYWTGRGLEREKLVMGIPFYGAPDMPYFKLVQEDPQSAQVDSFEYFGRTYRYNGIPSVQAKTRLAMERASGIMFWALDHDIQGDLSLVSAIYEAAHD